MYDKLHIIQYNQSLKFYLIKARLQVGEFVVALGSPHQLSNTVTFGIVSAMARHGTDLGVSTILYFNSINDAFICIDDMNCII